MIGSGSLCSYSEDESSGNFAVPDSAGFVVKFSSDGKPDFVWLPQLLHPLLQVEQHGPLVWILPPLWNKA